MFGGHRSAVWWAGSFVLVVAGCGTTVADGAAGLNVMGPPGARPRVERPEGRPPALPEIRTLRRGAGNPVKRGDVVVTNVEIRIWDGLRPYLNTWDTRQPTTVPLDGEHVGKSWEEALIGSRPGGRVLLVSPARLGLGPKGLAPARVSPSDTLVEVFDVVGSYPAGAQVSGAAKAVGAGLPPVNVPSGGEPSLGKVSQGAPKALTVRGLVEGRGAPVRAGSTFVLNYAAFVWGQERAYDSSYRRGGPNGFVLEERAVPPGWVEGLNGVRAGSRVVIVVPAAMGRGFRMTKGGVVAPPGQDVVYVIDVLDVR